MLKTVTANPASAETKNASLPNSIELVSGEYWNPIPRTYSQYTSLAVVIDSEVKKAFGGTGFSAYTRPLTRFNDRGEAYVEKLTIQLDANYYNYGKKPPYEALQYVIDHFKLFDNSARLSEDRHMLEFMFQGTLVQIGSVAERIRGTGAYPYGEVINLLFGYEGEIYKVFRILLNKFDFDLTQESLVTYRLLDNGSVYKEYNVTSGLEVINKILGTSVRSAPYMYSFTSRREFVNWLLKSKYIGKSTFDIDENGDYIGPADYYGSSLYREVVDLVRASDTDQNPPVLPETIRKYQHKYWETRNVHEYREMIKDSATYIESKLMNAKLSDDLITEVTSLNGPEVIQSFRKNFEYKVSEKEDFKFFLLSSSEDTIRERVASVFSSMK